MLFSIPLFIISWISFFIFADKSRFHQFYPTCLFAAYLSCAVDFLATEHYVLWDYPKGTRTQTYLYHVLQQWGVYFVVVYLFLQKLPKKQKLLTFIPYVFYWTLIALMIEWIAVKTGFMKHEKWWGLQWSYVADWALYFLFYFHHKWRERGMSRLVR